MKITYKGDYALKAILELALNYSNGVITIHDLARRLDIPVKFLEQVLLVLKKGTFVESRRGKVGGYLLARHPSGIKLGDVIRFIDGPIEPLPCAGLDNKYKGCADMHKCVFKNIWAEVADSISNVVDEVTFEDLCQKARAAKKKVVYQI